MGWKSWAAAGIVVLIGAGALSEDPAEEDTALQSSASSVSDRTDPAAEIADEEPVGALLSVTDLKDGDSWVASDDQEYRLGLVNTPEKDEPCASAAAAFTQSFLASGFTTDSYSRDTHGRVVAEVFDPDGTSLNVALAASGLGDDRYLDEFRHENPDLASRVEKAMSSAAIPECTKVAKPAPLVKKPAPAKKAAPPKNDCADGYSPCLPIASDLNCPDVGGPVTVTGVDQYGLDRDGDGIGCD